MAKTTTRSGVTLIELLIVVLILAALSAIAIPRISVAAANAKANACKTNIDSLNSALEQFYVQNGTYPFKIWGVSKSLLFFPDGEPICPVTAAVYPEMLNANSRVDDAAHAH